MTYVLIAFNLLVYLLELQNPYYYVMEFGLSPAMIFQGRALHTLLTSMFLHHPFDIFHLCLNMLVLFLVGDDCEQAIGSFRFLGFYLISGISSGLFHSCLNSTSTVPTIGASGAIFGVLAVYTILFPFRRVIAFFDLIPVPLPAILCAFLLVLTETSYFVSGGLHYVAHMAHLGGFTSGAFLASLFGPKGSIEESRMDA